MTEFTTEEKDILKSVLYKEVAELTNQVRTNVLGDAAYAGAIEAIRSITEKSGLGDVIQRYIDNEVYAFWDRQAEESATHYL